MTKIAVCTVNFNGKNDTLELLQSLKNLHTNNLETKVFVVDGGSSDGSVEEIASKFPQVEIIKKTQNRGSAGGYNDGAKAALKWGAQSILLINNDTLVKDSNLLLDLKKTLDSDPSIGVVSPKMYFAPGFEFHKDRYTDKDRGNVLWYAGGSFDWNNINSNHRGIDEIDSKKYDLVEETNFTNTTCILVRSEIFKREIFFDEGLFAYFDDNDFLQKVKKSGFKLYYDGLTNLYHKVSRTSGIGSPTTDYYTTRNRLIFGFRHASLHTKIALLKQAVSFFISGRPMQKKGVLDFFLGKRGCM